jgi:hypothetical protein
MLNAGFPANTGSGCLGWLLLLCRRCMKLLHTPCVVAKPALLCFCCCAGLLLPSASVNFTAAAGTSPTLASSAAIGELDVGSSWESYTDWRGVERLHWGRLITAAAAMIWLLCCGSRELDPLVRKHDNMCERERVTNSHRAVAHSPNRRRMSPDRAQSMAAAAAAAAAAAHAVTWDEPQL